MVLPTIYVVFQGDYGQRIVEHLAAHGFSRQIVGVHEFPRGTPSFIDDPTEYLPKNIPQGDLVLALDLQPDLLSLLPRIVAESHSKAVLVPVDHPELVPPGLERQLQTLLEPRGITIAFPRPFCALEKMGNPIIDAFAERVGRPYLAILCKRDQVAHVQVWRGAPCGSTWYAAERIKGIHRNDAGRVGALAVHTYPCLGARDRDPILGDTVIHKSAQLFQEAVDSALARPQPKTLKAKPSSSQIDK